MNRPVKPDTGLLEELSHFWERNNYFPGVAPGQIRAHLRWKYDLRYVTLYLEKQRRNIIGSCGYLEYACQTQAGPFCAWWGLDSLTERDFALAGQFSFLKVAGPILRSVNHDRQILLCFPNHVVKRIYLRFGFTTVGNPAIYALNIGRGAVSVRAPSGLELVWGRDFTDRSAGTLASRLNTRFSFLSARDEDYLRWRYGDCELKKHVWLRALKGSEVAGYAVLRFEAAGQGKVAYVTDILCDPEDRQLTSVLLREIIGFCREKDITAVRTLLNDHRFVRAALACGFAKERDEDVVFWSRNPAVKNLFSGERCMAHITMGDGDYDME